MQSVTALGTAIVTDGEKGAEEFHAEVARRVSGIPGVRAAGAVLNLPMGGSNTSGDISFGSVAPRGPPADTRRWFGLNATDLSGSFHVGTVVSASLRDVAILVNSGSATLPATASGLDWTAVLGTHAPASLAGIAGDQLHVSGTLESLDIAGLVTGSGGFGVTKSLVDVTVDSL